MAEDGVVDAGVEVAELGEAGRHGGHREVARLDGRRPRPSVIGVDTVAVGTPRTE